MQVKLLKHPQKPEMSKSLVGASIGVNAAKLSSAGAENIYNYSDRVVLMYELLTVTEAKQCSIHYNQIS